MLYIWMFFILFALLIVGSALILNHQELEVIKREKMVDERIWAQVNRIPLLIEIIKKNGVALPFEQIIELRAKVMESPNLYNKVGLEGRLIHLLGDTLRQCESSEVAKEPLFLSVKKEFEEGIEAVRISVNDYNFAITVWKKYCKFPWFKIVEFAFDTRLRSTLQYI